MKRIDLVVLFCFLLAACGNHSSQPSLPFYNSPDFTPEWLTPSDKGYESLHHIAPFSFINQDSARITNKQVEGKIYVAGFFFTTCGSICPRMMANLKKVNDAFAQNDRVLLLSHTVLPETDSVQRLKAYAQKRGIDSRHWWLLTGNKEEIYKLARTSYFADDTLGYSNTGADFLHTENCVLVDGKGRLRGVYNATLELEMDKLIEHINLLLKE
jgi:protein SCO1/2